MSATSDAVLAIAKRYLGPAAKTFLERQTKFHMQNTAFDSIGPEQLPMLFKWILISARLVIDSRAEDLVSSLEYVLKVDRAQ